MFVVVKDVPLQDHEIDFHVENNMPTSGPQYAYLTWYDDMLDFSAWDGELHPWRTIVNNDRVSTIQCLTLCALEQELAQWHYELPKDSIIIQV